MADVIDGLGCTSVDELRGAAAVMEGGAAVSAFDCHVGPITAHVFERNSLRDVSGVGAAGGGTEENIDRTVGTGYTNRNGDGDCQSWLLLGETWFVVSESEELLDDASSELGGVVRDVVPATPQWSYVPPGCD